MLVNLYSKPKQLLLGARCGCRSTRVQAPLSFLFVLLVRQYQAGNGKSMRKRGYWMYIVRHGKPSALKGIHLARDVSLMVVLSWTARLYDAYFGSEALLKWGGVYWPLVAQPGHLPDVSPARRVLGLRTNLRKSREGRGAGGECKAYASLRSCQARAHLCHLEGFTPRAIPVDVREPRR